MSKTEYSRRSAMKTIMILSAAWIGATSLLPVASAVGGEKEAINIGSRRELFVDDYLIGKLSNTRLELHEPTSAGICLTYDKPWEGVYSSYNTIIRDSDIYRMYYMGMKPPSLRFTCYAQSKDGIHWTKPNLEIHKVDGTLNNNVVLIDAQSGTNFAPFLDTNPQALQSERYKAVTRVSGGLLAYASADGLHWKKMSERKIITKGAFDSHNIPFYSESEKRYLCYFRFFDKGVRAVRRSESQDFLHWTDPVDMTYGDTPPEHLYTTSTTPYYRAPHIYIALPSRFMAGKDVVSQAMKKQLGVTAGYLPKGEGFSDMPLMTTRGGSTYQRTFMETFIPAGIGLKNWTSRANYPAVGIVPTPDSKTHLSLYVSHEIGYPSVNLTRYTLRYDGFISVNAPYSGGEMTTKPLTFQGKKLSINYATSAPGYVRVEIQDAAGKPIPGFTLADSAEIIGDEIDRTVSWKNGADVSRLAGRPIRLRFVMKAADLYSFQFVK